MSSKRPKTAQTTNGTRPPSRRTRVEATPEPIAARALQALILVVGVMLLFSVIFDGRWGPVVVGILIISTALPPMRRHVDKWLVGKARGSEANQAALLRIAAGAGIVTLALLGVFMP